MIEKREYRDWSKEFHDHFAMDPIVIQMELTYRCPLHCLHCYSDCYNLPDMEEKELSTDSVKKIIDKLYDSKCLWLSFTGGDPMQRKDFSEIYEYAKDKGFIITVLTSLAAMNDRVFELLVRKPPFSLSMTLNGVTEYTYEKVSGVKGSFPGVMRNIDRCLKAGLPLGIKTLLSKNNIGELNQIKEFVEARTGKFIPSVSINARFNCDTSVCRYRLDPQEVMKLDFPDEDCEAFEENDLMGRNKNGLKPVSDRLFRCAVGNWQWHIDPFGELKVCTYLRQPAYDILKGDIIEGVKMLSNYVKSSRFKTASKCKTCDISHLCNWCPAKARLEVGDEEAPIPHFCRMARLKDKILSKTARKGTCDG